MAACRTRPPRRSWPGGVRAAEAGDPHRAESDRKPLNVGGDASVSAAVGLIRRGAEGLPVQRP